MATFIFCGIKAHIYGDKKNTFSVPSLTVFGFLNVFGFLAYNLLCILKLHRIVLVTSKIHLIFLEIRHVGIYKFQLPNFEPFLMNHKQAILIKEFLKDDLQSEYTVLNLLSRMRLILLFNAQESNIHIKGQ